MPFIECDYCKKEIRIPNSKLKEYKNHFCSIGCKGNFKTLKTIQEYEKRFNIKNMEKWLIKKYINERLSYREIMKLLETKCNRNIKSFLSYYDIPIRQGGEAIKTQWENNPERRKQIAESFSMSNKNKVSIRRVTEKELKKRLKSKNMTYISRESVDDYMIIEYICDVCKNKNKMSMKNINKRGCPVCNASKGEQIIKEYLEFNKIEFIREFRFKDCKSKNTLPFDFYLIKQNLCIEYDGEFHYKELTMGNDLKLQKKR